MKRRIIKYHKERIETINKDIKFLSKDILKIKYFPERKNTINN